MAAFAVAVILASLILVALIGNASGPESIRRTINQLDPGDRSLTVVYAPFNSPTATDIRSLDNSIVRALAQPGLSEPIKVVQYRPLATMTGGSFRFVGIDDIERSVRLRSGRLPRRCDSTCEVVVLRNPTSPSQPQPAFGPEYGLTVVGQVERTNPTLLTGQLAADGDEWLVLAPGVANATAFAPFERFRKTFAWQAPLDPTQLTRQVITQLFAATGRINRIPDRENVRATLPDRALETSLIRKQITTNRLWFPRAIAWALGLGMAALIGFAMRTDHQRAVALLRRRSASPITIWALRVTEVALPMLVGLFGAFAVTALVGPRIAQRAVKSSIRFGWNDLYGPGDLQVLLMFAVALFVIAAATLTFADHAPLRGLRPTDIIGLVAAAGLAVLSNTRANGSTSYRRFDSFLVALPLLSALIACAVAVRLAPVVLGGLGRLLRSRPLARLGVIDGLRQPWRPLAAICVLTSTIMFFTVAIGYSSTLRTGAADQAAFEVPYDARIGMGPALVRPIERRPPSGWSTTSEGVVATDVLRRGVTLRGNGTISTTVEVLGVDPATLGALHGWRDSFGAHPSTFASRLHTTTDARPGVALPKGTVAIRLIGRGFSNLAIAVVTAHADERWREFQTTDDDPNGAGDPGGSGLEHRVATVDEDSATTAGATAAQYLTGLRIAVSSNAARLIEHQIGEGATSTSAGATPYDVTLAAVEAVDAQGRSTAINIDPALWRSRRAQVAVNDGDMEAQGSLLGESAIVSLNTKAFEEPVPAIVDPQTMRLAVRGIVWIDASQGRLPIRPIGVIERFPGVGSRFAIANVAALQPALDTLEPGLGAVNEVWLAAGRSANTTGTAERTLSSALRDARYSDLAISLRQDRVTLRSDDPLSRATISILLLSSLISLALGAVFLQLSTASDRLDDAELHRSLALQGVRPRNLVALVMNKSLAGLLVAVPVGVVAGIWLLNAVTHQLGIGADAIAPVPALRVSLPVLTLVVGVMVFLTACTALCWIVARPVRRLWSEDLLRGTT